MPVKTDNPAKCPRSGAPLRISVVEPSGKPYGSELALLEILAGLHGDSIRAEVVLPRGSALAEPLNQAGIPFLDWLPSEVRHGSPFKKALSYSRLMLHWRRQRPDLVYVNQGGILRPVVLMARRSRIPILCQVQTLEDAQWVGTLRAQHPAVSTFVCNSQFIARHCAVPGNQLSTVYHGYQPKALQRERRAGRLNPERLQVGLLGRICESKGHYFVIKAACKLKAQARIPIHFRFVGEAPTAEERTRVRRLVEEDGLADTIEFRGYRTELAAEFAGMDLLVVPSQAEPFGRVFCEAAEARVPVLLADSGGLGELSRRYDAGMRFTPGDEQGFCDQLQVIADSYGSVWAAFAVAGARMLRALDFKAYLGVVNDLISCAASGRHISQDWLGNL